MGVNMQLELRVASEAKDQEGVRRARSFSSRILTRLVKVPALAWLSRHKVALSVRLVGPAVMQKLNRRYRKKNKPTNVLSFPLFVPRELARRKTKRGLMELGDIVICPTIIRKEAKVAKASYYQQFFWILAHGILHTLGYDHERTARERRAMERLEQHLRRSFRP